ncbi:Doublesex-and mab-3-related transcription factor 3 [Strongyloides ratti]|uniref:Doublesex-and mab-3-related transcription factor 3 n=1 Tax=Strongyloides ratti TaxID=34506 RepID=A0A090LV68_STRRB|nr:Doublesex-and mab-3-related transcription factor 3 [Strongyloides ratti]CEF71559.1 Doublesex-and mab-3-related transcription factor 3 [Strongyloides ratti]
MNQLNNDNSSNEPSLTMLTDSSDSLNTSFSDNQNMVKVIKNQKKKQVTNCNIKRLYYCQRCINHNQRVLRKGHKNFCSYADCECPKCSMVSKRRYLNSKLHRKLIDKHLLTNEPTKKNLPKERVPTCALCAVHGCKILLRGHRKIDCPYYGCRCELCIIIVNRRDLMAKQIKLRRLQSNPKKFEKEMRKLLSLNELKDDSLKKKDFSFATLPKYVEYQSNLKEQSEKNDIKNIDNKNMENNFIHAQKITPSFSNNEINLNTNIISDKLMDDNLINSSNPSLTSSNAISLSNTTIKDLEKALQIQLKSTNSTINNSLHTFQQNSLQSLTLMDNIKNGIRNSITNNISSTQIPPNTINFLPLLNKFPQQIMYPMFGNMVQIFPQPGNIHDQNLQSNFNLINYQNNLFSNNSQLDIRNMLMQHNYIPFNIWDL